MVYKNISFDRWYTQQKSPCKALPLKQAIYEKYKKPVVIKKSAAPVPLQR